MKKILALVLTALCAIPAYGQNVGTVANHAFAIGKGPGVTGYTSMLCTSAQLAVGQAAADPLCRTITGDWTISAAGVATLATVNANTGAFGDATHCVTVTNNAKGLTTAVSSAVCTPAIGSVSGLGTGVAAALAVNIGSAGAPVLFNGAGGTPASVTLTNGTGLPIGTGVSGLGTGVATALGVNVGSAGAFVVNGGALGTPSAGVATNLTGTAAGLTAGTVTINANLTGAVTSVGNATSLGSFTSAQARAAYSDETGTGAAYFQSGDLGTPTAGVLTNATGTAAGLTAGHVTTNANLTGLVTSVGNATSLAFGQLTNSLGGNVNMTSATTYFDGPSIAQGSTGTWYASGTVTLADATATPITNCKLWDGTTIIAAAPTNQLNNSWYSISLSGFIASPAGNIRISCSSSTGTTNIIRAATQDSTAKASTVSAFRIN